MTRLEKISQRLRDTSTEALALTPGATLQYVTGFGFEPSDRLLLAIIPAQGDLIAILPNFEESNWRENVQFEAKLFLWDDTQGPQDAVKRALKSLSPISTLAIEPLVMRVMEQDAIRNCIPDTKLIPATEIVEPIRLAKDKDEIVAMRVANAIAGGALEQLLENVEVGVSERLLAGLLCSFLYERAGETISFGPIVLSGPRSALPHGVPSDRELQKGDLLLIDFGTSYKGYHCDITRTFVIGKPDDQTKEIYDAVLKGNERGRKACAPGVTCDEVHRQAQTHLHEPQFADYLKHRTGHGLGLEIHEPPSVMEGNMEVLAPGTVITIEPGLYLQGWGGIRIEDDMLITQTGAESLTTFPRELRTIA